MPSRRRTTAVSAITSMPSVGTGPKWISPKTWTVECDRLDGKLKSSRDMSICRRNSQIAAEQPSSPSNQYAAGWVTQVSRGWWVHLEASNASADIVPKLSENEIRSARVCPLLLGAWPWIESVSSPATQGDRVQPIKLAMNSVKIEFLSRLVFMLVERRMTLLVGRTLRIRRRRAQDVADTTDSLRAVACIRFVRLCWCIVAAHFVARELPE